EDGLRIGAEVRGEIEPPSESPSGMRAFGRASCRKAETENDWTARPDSDRGDRQDPVVQAGNVARQRSQDGRASRRRRLRGRRHRPPDLDGFVSWESEKNSGTKMTAALGTRELRYGALVWMHGGGSSGAIGLASMAIAADRCWKHAGYGPADVDVVQVYANVSTAAVAGL